MPCGRKCYFADFVLAVLMSMRSIESFVIPVILADRVADTFPGFNYTGHASLQRHPCQDENGTSRDPILNSIQAEASHWAMIYWLTTALPGAFIAILLGGWSDRIGRRLLMVIGSLGYVLESGLAISVVFWNLPLWVLIIGSSLEGLMGSFPAILLAVYSYTSDRSEIKTRTARLVLLDVAICIGAGLGNVAGGLLLKNFGPLAAEGLVFGGHFINVLYIGLVLSESCENEQQHSHGWRGEAVVSERKPLLEAQRMKNPILQSQSVEHSVDLHTNHRSHDNMALFINSLKTTFGLVFKASPIRARLLVILFSFELLVMNYIGVKDFLVLYTMHQPLCWTSDFYGYFMAARDGARTFSLTSFAIISQFWQPPDRRVVQVGVFAMICYLITISMASATWIMYLGTFFSSIGGPGTVTLRAMASKLVDKSNHGAVFATIAFLETIVTVLASVIYNNLYAVFVKEPSLSEKYMPNPGGRCFLVVSGLNLIPILLMQVLPTDKREDSSTEIIDGSAVRNDQNDGYGSRADKYADRPRLRNALAGLPSNGRVPTADVDNTVTQANDLQTHSGHIADVNGSIQ